MYRYILLFLLILAGIIFLFRITQNTERITRVDGRIDYRISNRGWIYFRIDSPCIERYFKSPIKDSALVSENGTFSFFFQSHSHPVFFDITNKRDFIAHHYYLSPGDHLRLDFEGKEIPVSLASFKDCGRYNSFLQEFIDSFYRNKEVKQFYYISSNYLMAPEFSRYINQRRQEQIHFFKKYFDEPAADSVFIRYFLAELNYQWASDKLNFLWKKRLRKEWVPVDSSYFDFLQLRGNSSGENLICPTYGRFIALLMREWYQQQNEFPGSGKISDMEKCKLAELAFTGLDLEMAYLSILQDRFENKKESNIEPSRMNNSGFDEILKRAFSHTRNPLFNNLVKDHDKIKTLDLNR